MATETGKFDNKETEGGNEEVAAELKDLDETAGEVGEQLESTDPKYLTPEGLRIVKEGIERVLGSVYMLAGSAAAASVWEAADDIGHQMDSVEKAIAAVVAVAGISIAVVGFNKLINGTKKFFEELTPEQKAGIEV